MRQEHSFRQRPNEPWRKSSEHPIRTRAQPADVASYKIVILICAFIRGGCERQAYLLARELRQRHHLDAEVWALMEGGEYAKEFEHAGIPTRVLGFHRPESPLRLVRGLQWGRGLQRMVRQVRQGRVDVLLPFTLWPNVVAGLTYRLAGGQVCIWGERSAGTERLPSPERIAIRRYQQFVANSTAGVEFLAGEMRVQRERIFFVPNGVEEPKFDVGADWRARLGLCPGQPLVVKVANVTSFKDHATLLRAWKIVQDAWPGRDKPFLALAGSVAGEAYDVCRKISREAGLDSTVRFLGLVPDVPALIHASDMAAFSSPKEGMPNGVLECMAAGKAVVASDLPGIRDALGPNAAEVLVPPGDANQFARRLLDLLRDKERRDSLGEGNRARIRAGFSVEHMAERYLKVIETSMSAAWAGRGARQESLSATPHPLS